MAKIYHTLGVSVPFAVKGLVADYIANEIEKLEAKVYDFIDEEIENDTTLYIVEWVNETLPSKVLVPKCIENEDEVIDWITDLYENAVFSISKVENNKE